MGMTYPMLKPNGNNTAVVMSNAPATEIGTSLGRLKPKAFVVDLPIEFKPTNNDFQNQSLQEVVL